MNRPGTPSRLFSFQIRCLLGTAILCWLGAARLAAQSAAQSGAKTLATADYGKWESLGSATLSPDGKWLAYQVRRNDGESKLQLRGASRSIDKDAQKEFEYGSGQVFSADNHFLAFRIGTSDKAREKATKAKKPVQSRLGLHDLRSGETEEIDDVASFEFSDDGKHLLLRRYKPKGRKGSGVDLLVRNLANGRHTTFGNVASYSWVDDGSLLAMVIDTEDKLGNGVVVYDTDGGQLQTLDSSRFKYSSLVWRKDAADLAVLRDRQHEDDEDSSFVVLTWRHLNTPKPVAKAYDHLVDKSFPANMRVVDYAGLRWSDDGETVFFGIKTWEHKPKPAKKDKSKGAGKDNDKPKASKKDKDGEKKDSKPAKTLQESLEDPAGVEIWHAKDIEIQPRQKKVAARKKNENSLAAWWLESGNFVRIADDITERATLAKKQKRAFGFDNTPYETLKRFGPTLTDIYVIDVRTGERRRVLERVKYQHGSSPDGRYLVYVKDKHIWSYDIQDDKHRNLTRSVTTPFINQELSSLTDEKPAYGIAGWSESGNSLYLYSRYDMWMFRPNGQGTRRLTRGAEQKIRYRRVILDRDEDEFIDPSRTIYYSIYGDLSKKSGYAIAKKNAPLRSLMFRDKRIGRLVKAKDASTIAYVEEGFDDSPDVFVTNTSNSRKPRQISATNAFQKDYDWGRSELVGFTNVHGKKMQAALHYPAGYVKGKQYPMIVYIYELRSQNLHRYTTPSERSPYNASVFTTQGYFVLQPDIVYRPQNPGLSAVECVVPAVKSVLARGEVDPKRVGLVGHSWGAYQTAFIVTQTDVFAAGVAGAPLTNMMSMSMSIYWNSGRTDAWIFHESQGRMDQPFWRDVDTYMANSPIFNIDKLNTPLLIAFGDKDGAVDWHQGIEMYNAARLVQKPLVMLVYAGENHGLRKKPNQVDYHHRVRHWFDHHLKGVKARPWITKGKTHLARAKELDDRKRAKKNKQGGGDKSSEDSARKDGANKDGDKGK